MLKYHVFETRLGWVGAVASECGIRHMTLPEPSRRAAEQEIATENAGVVRDAGHFADLEARLDRYFAGGNEDLTTIPVDPVGTASGFFAKAREACRAIPAGETRTYAWLAARAGSPGASRAAGQAMARNPVPLLVPCHRVVGTDGKLHGFGGSIGTPLKARLLAIEAAAQQR